jgi:DNA (cytosine-5)-methyltransferase 1
VGDTDLGGEVALGGVQKGPRTERAPGVRFWDDFSLISCLDGKARRVPQSVFFGVADGVPENLDEVPAEEGLPLAKGVEGRVGALRGFGNAIVPEIAAEFVRAVMEALEP